MNGKFLRSLATATVLTSLAHTAIAQTPSEHPAVVVARPWSSRGIDTNTFIVRHPTGQIWLNAAPTAKETATREPTTRLERAQASTPHFKGERGSA